MIRKTIILVFTVLLSLGAAAQKEDSLAIKNIADNILIHGTAYENLRQICKKIGPRLSGSTQAQKAVEVTAKMLKDAGADTVYLQECKVPHWLRGAKEQCKLFSKKLKILSVLASRYSRNFIFFNTLS